MPICAYRLEQHCEVSKVWYGTSDKVGSTRTRHSEEPPIPHAGQARVSQPSSLQKIRSIVECIIPPYLISVRVNHGEP